MKLKWMQSLHNRLARGDKQPCTINSLTNISFLFNLYLFILGYPIENKDFVAVEFKIKIPQCTVHISRQCSSIKSRLKSKSIKNVNLDSLFGGDFAISDVFMCAVAIGVSPTVCHCLRNPHSRGHSRGLDG